MKPERIWMKKCNYLYKIYFKRILDLFMAIIILIILLPFLIIVALVLKLTGENHIFYFQDRVGHRNSIFKIWKFATMVKNSPKIGTGSLTLKNDPRILPFGRFLRKTKINELPQIINVIIGNMSIVGPRPQMEVDFIKFPKKIQNRIYESMPGVTGIGSIVFRDEEKWISSFKGDKHLYYKKYIAPYKGELEIWYQNNLSLANDLKIILLTILVILYPETNLQYKILKGLPEKPHHLK